MNRTKIQYGLLFSLSGENGFCAELAAGTPSPNYLEGVKIINDGFNGGHAFHCDGSVLRMSYLAAGNIFASRGTLCLRFRSVYPVGITPFPIFRVGFSDHTSWDAVFLRIDYNGDGFEAFVTDTGLSRIRVKTEHITPLQDQWTHIAFAWDETRGVKLYINGELCAQKQAFASLDAGLDQFGPFSRLISHWNVQSMFNYVRGGDLDDVMIFDHMLEDDDVRTVFLGDMSLPLPQGDISALNQAALKAWIHRHGWDHPASMPAAIAPGITNVRKVEIHDAYDGPKWFWKACDGIRETTWPGVYNRSRLPGRFDYFLLPDWDCYSLSGKQIRFLLPQEQWNHIEVIGAAYGTLSVSDISLRREKGEERSSYRLAQAITGGELIFTNEVQETPLSELSVYAVQEIEELPNLPMDRFTFNTGRINEPFCQQIYDEIEGRRLPEERNIWTALAQPESSNETSGYCAHLLIPGSSLSGEALYKIALHLPEKTCDGLTSMNLQVHDPLWNDRMLMDYSFSILPRVSCTLLLEPRKRILRPQDGLCITLNASYAIFDHDYMSRLAVTVYYTSREDAREQHIQDRFTQIRDVYSHMVEERPGDPRLRLFRRFKTDIYDLLSIAPDHYLAQCYLYDSLSTCNARLTGVAKPIYWQKPLKGNVPAWAQRQLEYMTAVKRFLSWWITQRQVENGEFGGGLSDDGDLTSWWPGPALCGLMAHTIQMSLKQEMGAFLEQGMLTNGLSTIQTDEMHVFEEGITALGQCLLTDFSNPRWLELAMDNALGIERISAFNIAGHRHFMSSYYSGVTMAREDPWQMSTGNSYLVCHPLYMLARYNHSPRLIRLICELADGLTAHWKNGEMHCDIRFEDDTDAVGESDRWYWCLVAAYRLTGDGKYLIPLQGHITLQKKASDQPDDTAVANIYENLLESAALREYLNTDAHLWVDRVVLDIEQLQMDRLGGVAHQRFQVYPYHYLSWEFANESEAELVAILTPEASETRISIRAYNTCSHPVAATMTLWDVTGGNWRIYDGHSTVYKALRYASRHDVVFAAQAYTELVLTLEQANDEIRPLADLGLSERDIRIETSGIRVTIHSLGSVSAEPTVVVLLNPDGALVASCRIPALEAPQDLKPVCYDTILSVPISLDITGYQVVIDPDHVLNEITRVNNTFTF